MNKHVLPNEYNSSNNLQEEYNKIDQKYYQKGYADGYKYYDKIHNNYRYEYQYMYVIVLILIIFTLFVLITVYMYNPKIIRNDSNYKGDCLLGLSSVFHTEGCLDK